MSQPQYMDALARANEVRIARADLKQEVTEGRLSLTAALVDSRAEGLTVLKLLLCQHRWGVRTSRRVLNRLRIGEWKRVGALTDRQRVLLVQACSPKREAA